jgi:hypothetical protein
LIGIANDAFELSVIEREFKELKLDAGDDEDNEDDCIQRRKEATNFCGPL